MKKNYLFAVALGAAVLTGCSQDEQLGMMQENRSGFTGALELSDSRTTLGEDNKVNWVEGVDEVSIFEMDDQNTQYKVKSVSNGVAQFEFVDYIPKTNPVSFDDYYSVYPYDDVNSISAEGDISAAVPSKIENYSGKDDAVSQALMVAKSKTTDLKYSNAQGILLLRLNAQKPTNYGAIKSIKLTSAKYKLAGTATMSWADGVEKPEAKIGDDGTSELTIELASALQAELPKSASGEYAEYYIPVVPTVFEKNRDGTGDVTMTITWTNGNTYEKNIDIEFTVGRNKIKPLKHTVGSKDFTGEIEGTENVVSSEEELLEVLAKGGTVTLQSDITLTNGVEIAAGVASKINLNGKTLNTAGNAITVKGDLIVSNGTVEAQTGAEDLNFAFAVSAGGTLKVESDAKVTAKENGTAAIYMEGGELNMDGTIEVEGTNNVGIFMYGTEADININGTISAGEGTYAIQQIGGTTNVSVGENGSLGKSSLGTAGTMNLTYACAAMPVVETDGTDTILNISAMVKDADALAAAVAAGATNLYLMPGEYHVKNCGGKTLTISGTKETVLKLMNEGEDGCDYGFGAAGTGVGNVTFNGLTINTTSNTGNYKGYAYMKGTFIDCDFVGPYSLNNKNDFVFNKCTFDFKGGYFWTWSAKSVTFEGCTFNGNSKAILAHGWESTVITIKDCTFAATEKGYANEGRDWTAAVEIDPAGTNVYTINFEGNNTKNENYVGWTRIKDGSTGHTFTGLN